MGKKIVSIEFISKIVIKPFKKKVNNHYEGIKVKIRKKNLIILKSVIL